MLRDEWYARDAESYWVSLRSKTLVSGWNRDVFVLLIEREGTTTPRPAKYPSGATSRPPRRQPSGTVLSAILLLSTTCP